MAPEVTALWRFEPDLQGYAFVTLRESSSGYRAEGRAIAAYQGDEWSVNFVVSSDEAWMTRSVEIRTVDDSGTVRTSVAERDDSAWTIAGRDRPELATCIDVDLGYMPYTNTLPIRRLNLPVGGSAEIDALWFDIPTLEPHLSHQGYERVANDHYVYRALDSGASYDVTVDVHGLVVDYAGLAVRVRP